MARGNSEFELKFTGAAGDLSALPDSLFLKAVRHDPGGWERLSSTYFDTPGRDLEAAGLSLRLREEGERIVQAVKRQKFPGAPARDEFERDVEGGTPFPASTGDSGVDAMLDAHRGALGPVAKTMVDRWSTLLHFGAAQIALAVDLGRAEGAGAHGAIPAPIAELELELVDGEKCDLFDCALFLITAVPLKFSTRTKLDYARSLGEGGPYKISSPKKLAPPSDATAADALHEALTLLAARIASLQPVIVETRNPDGIHQMRVALRRLRAIERTYRPFLKTGSLRKVAQTARLYAKSLGPVRDWDVFVDETLPAVFGTADGPAGAAALKASASKKRAESWMAAIKTIDNQEFTQFVLSLAEIAACRDWMAAEGADLEMTIAGLAPLALDRRLKKARKVAERIDRRHLAGWHPLRIALKKLRYPAQMFRSVWPKTARKPYMSALTSLQDAFGHINDAASAQRLANEAAAGNGGEAMRAAGFVCGYKAAEAEAAAKDVEAEWEKFKQAAAYWRK